MSAPAMPRHRPSASPMELGIALGGGLALAAVLVAILRPATTSDAPTAELTSAPAAAPGASDYAPIVASVPAEISSAPAPAPTAPADGLVLHGVLGSSAIIATPDGRQRLVRVGRPILPGVILDGVAVSSVVLAANGERLRLTLFDGGKGASAERIGAVGSPAPAGGSAPRPNARIAAPANPAQASAEYRQGLAPRMEGGAITGYAIRPSSAMPLLEGAGLRPGDVLIGVNGRAFASEAEVNQLAREAKLSRTLVFEYERDGKRMETRIDIEE